MLGQIGRTKIITRLVLGFSLLLLAALFIGILGATSIRSLSELTSNIFKHPFTVTTSILEVRADVLTAQKILTNLVHNASPGEIESIERRLVVAAAARRQEHRPRSRAIPRQQG